MTKPKVEITLYGRTYDMDSVADATSVQAELVPDNWKANKSDCVRLMLAIQEMLAHHLKRHLAANWKRICQQIQENKEAGDGATLGLGFKFELDQSVPQVAAIRGHSLKYSVSYGTTGKPQTVDLTQGELRLEVSETLDAGTITHETAAAEEFERQAKEDEAAEKKRQEDEAQAAREKAEADAPDANAGEKKVAKRKRNRKKDAG